MVPGGFAETLAHFIKVCKGTKQRSLEGLGLDLGYQAGLLCK